MPLFFRGEGGRLKEPQRGQRVGCTGGDGGARASENDKLSAAAICLKLLSLTDCVNKELRNNRGLSVYIAGSPDADTRRAATVAVFEGAHLSCRLLVMSAGSVELLIYPL